MPAISKAQLKIYISENSIDTREDSAKYVLNKTKIQGEKSITFEVSELIKDYINVHYEGDQTEAVTTVFVQFDLTRTFDDDTTDNLTQKAVAFLGYGYQDEGINPQLSRDVLITNRTVYVADGYPIRIPFLTIGDDGLTSVSYVDANGSEISKLASLSEIIALRVDSDVYRADNSSNEITADRTFLVATSQNTITNETNAPLNTREIRFKRKDGTELRIVVKILKECKYEPYRVTFINKYGALQDLFFFKVRKDSNTFTRTDYEKSILKISERGADYSSFEHQTHRLDVDGVNSFEMNTGFVTEDHTEVIKELLLTEYAWIEEDGITKPIKPVQTQFDEKTEVNDKLINFTVQFEYANSIIQNVR